MLKKKISILFFLCWGAVYISAMEVTEIVPCGRLISLLATPDEGYQFVEWSDGDTINPRNIEVTQSFRLDAIFEPIYPPYPHGCQADYILPIVELYGKLLLLNRDSLTSMGYSIDESQVAWYSIVGEEDATNAENPDDVRITDGLYLELSVLPAGDYYAQIIIEDSIPTPGECATVLRSKAYLLRHSDLDNIRTRGNEVKKVVYRDHLYIVRGKDVYDAVGTLIKDINDTMMPVIK